MPLYLPQTGGSSGDDRLTVPLDTTTGWTSSAVGTGTASIETASNLVRFVAPSGGSPPLGGQSYYNLSSSLISDFSYNSLEVVSRIKTATNVDVNSRIVMVLRQASAAFPDLALIVWGDGSVETGWTNASSGFTSFSWSAPATLGLLGNDWLKIRISGSIFTAYYGTGATLPTDWQTLTSRTLTFRLIGEGTFKNVGFQGLHLTSAPASNVTIEFDNVTVKTI
jgi:hypothetical protein